MTSPNEYSRGLVVSFPEQPPTQQATRWVVLTDMESLTNLIYAPEEFAWWQTREEANAERDKHGDSDLRVVRIDIALTAESEARS